LDNLDQNNDALDLSAAMRTELGMLLRQARLNQKKEIGDVAKRLILSPSQVLNLEAGTMDSFHHERRYVHALKGYLFYLGLSRDLIINDKLQQLELASLQAVSSSASGVARLYKAGHGPAPLDSQTQRQRIYILAGSAAVVALIVLAVTLGGRLFSGSDETAAEPKQASSADTPNAVVTDNAISVAPPAAATTTQTAPEVKAPEPVAPAPAAVAAAPASNPAVTAVAPAADASPDLFANLKSTTLRIVFLGECWASLITTDGRRNERIFQPGQSIDVELDRVATLIIGNSPEVRLQVGSKPLDLTKSGALTGNVARLNQAILQKLVKP
jgi:cytoskeletal protein RodZ